MGKTISFPKSPRPKKGFGKLQYEQHPDYECWHGSLEQGVTYVIHEDTGTVQCKKCGVNLNPIWVLKQLWFLSDDAEKRHERNAKARQKKGRSAPTRL